MGSCRSVLIHSVRWLDSDLEIQRLDLSSLHPSSFDKASRDRHVSAGDRPRVSAKGGQYSTKELANQILVYYSEHLHI